MKKLGIGCVALIFLAILFILLLYFSLSSWMARDTYYIDIVDKANAGEVAASFSWALMENREIKAMVSPELWTDIDRWMDNHEVFECPPSLASFFLTDSTSTGVGGYDGLDEITYNYVNTIYCPTLRSPYSFEILGIKLERVNGEWKVTGWEEICEIRPGESNCVDLPTSFKPQPTPAAQPNTCMMKMATCPALVGSSDCCGWSCCAEVFPDLALA